MGCDDELKQGKSLFEPLQHGLLPLGMQVHVYFVDKNDPRSLDGSSVSQMRIQPHRPMCNIGHQADHVADTIAQRVNRQSSEIGVVSHNRIFRKIPLQSMPPGRREGNINRLTDCS